MKAKSKVQVRTLGGMVDAPCFHQWKQTVGGVEFEFALHIAAGHAKGFEAPLAISELRTGADVKAVMMHPNSRNPLTTNSAAAMKSGDVKKIARAALHRLLKKVGHMNFLQAVLGAEMRAANIDLSKYAVSDTDDMPEGKGGLATPGVATISGTMEVTYENSALLKALRDPSCKTCGDSRVLVTTDNDHEGNPIEIACTECIPKAIEVPETKVGVLMAEQLRERRSHLQERADQHGTMTGDTSEDEYGEICEEIDDLTQKIEELEATPCK